MFTESDEALTDLEEKMISAVDRAYEDWQEDTERPLPMSLVALMKNTHQAILARLGKRGGFDMASMMKNPEQGLVMLDRTKAILLRMIQQKSQAAKAS